MPLEERGLCEESKEAFPARRLKAAESLLLRNPIFSMNISLSMFRSVSVDLPLESLKKTVDSVRNKNQTPAFSRYVYSDHPSR